VVYDLTAACARFAAGFAELVPAAAEVATSGITDAVGVMLAGQHEPVVRAVRSVALQGAALGASSVLLSAQRTRGLDAALINASAAHALAMDDVAVGCHPSAILMPALLAEAEAIGSSGAELLRAYVVGFELLAELALRESDALHGGGWHPTGLLGPVAVAGAVANLRGLPLLQCSHALGIAASMSGGLQANFGTQTKALHAGRVASAGLWAVQLAAQGVTASPVALQHPKGLLRTVSPKGRVDLQSRMAFERGELRILSLGLSFKKYPLCYSTHRLIDAAIEIAAMPGFDARQVQSIAVATGRQQAALAPHQAPTSALEAKYSVAFAVAAGLLAGAAGFEQLDEAFIASPAVQGQLALTRIELRDDTSADDAVFCSSDRVVVQLQDGRLFDSGEVAYARGHARRPMRAEDLRRKFITCARSGGRDDAPALFDALCKLAEMADVRSLAMPA
jgi:2-methylcitrate dehydratase PrpD